MDINDLLARVNGAQRKENGTAYGTITQERSYSEVTLWQVLLIVDQRIG